MSTGSRKKKRKSKSVLDYLGTKYGKSNIVQQCLDDPFASTTTRKNHNTSKSPKKSKKRLSTKYSMYPNLTPDQPRKKRKVSDIDILNANEPIHHNGHNNRHNHNQKHKDEEDHEEDDDDDVIVLNKSPFSLRKAREQSHKKWDAQIKDGSFRSQRFGQESNAKDVKTRRICAYIQRYKKKKEDERKRKEEEERLRKEAQKKELEALDDEVAKKAVLAQASVSNIRDLKLRELNDEDEELIGEVFDLSPNEVVVTPQGSNIEVNVRDLQTLEEGQWLNEEVMNFYMALLQDRNLKRIKDNPKHICVLFMNTFFFTQLSSNSYNYKAVKQWTEKAELKKKGLCTMETIFELDKFIFPVRVNRNHWCCGCINFKHKKFEYYDSINGSATEFFRVIRKYLENEYEDKLKGDKTKYNLDLSEWSNDNHRDKYPQQQNGVDCGVFTSKCADWISDELYPDYSQQDMQYFRERIMVEIRRGRTLDYTSPAKTRRQTYNLYANAIIPTRNGHISTDDSGSINSRDPIPFPREKDRWKLHPHDSLDTQSAISTDDSDGSINSLQSAISTKRNKDFDETVSNWYRMSRRSKSRSPPPKSKSPMSQLSSKMSEAQDVLALSLRSKSKQQIAMREATQDAAQLSKRNKKKHNKKYTSLGNLFTNSNRNEKIKPYSRGNTGGKHKVKRRKSSAKHLFFAMRDSILYDLSCPKLSRNGEILTTDLHKKGYQDLIGISTEEKKKQITKLLSADLADFAEETDRMEITKLKPKKNEKVEIDLTNEEDEDMSMDIVILNTDNNSNNVNHEKQDEKEDDPRVVLLRTGTDWPLENKKLEALGAVVLSEYDDSVTHMVTAQPRTTLKFISGLASAKYIVTDAWCAECIKKRTLKVDESRYFPHNKATRDFEKQYGFKLKESFTRLQERSEALFDGYKVYFTKNIKNNAKKAIGTMAQSHGAVVITDAPNALPSLNHKYYKNVIVIGEDVNHKYCKNIAKKGYMVYNRDVIITTILRQHIFFQDEDFYLSHSQPMADAFDDRDMVLSPSKIQQRDFEEPPEKKQKLNKCKNEWNVNEVAEWVASLGDNYKQYGKEFADSAIDGELMNEIDRESLSEIVSRKIHCIKILLEWKKLN